ncbi:hypothetical protein T190130A13A_110021 [Tenacibaculum sp. 190130A14a]|uniref:hypothetical protein n=1 Tax=Tenacibaculum polynesiense TaxID=3137857 RepID=UPI003200951C
MSWYESLEELNDTFFIFNSEGIFNSLYNIYSNKLNLKEFSELLSQKIDRKNSQTKILSNLDTTLTNERNEFFINFNHYLDKKSTNPTTSSKIEITLINDFIKELRNENLTRLSSLLKHSFIQNECKKAIIDSYKLTIQQIERNFLNTKETGNKKSSINYFIIDKNAKKINYEKLNQNLKSLGLIHKDTKVASIENLFNEFQSNISWTGKKNELSFFIHTLKKLGYITNDKYWEVVKTIFKINNTPIQKRLQKVYDSNIPKSSEMIENAIKKSIKKW